MANDIVLTRHTIDYDVTLGPQHSWPMRVTAVSTITGLPSKIFVYHAVNADRAWEGDAFEAIASVQQLEELPEDQPTTGEDGTIIPYYRTSTMEVWLRSPELLADLWADIQTQVQDLINNFRAAATFDTTVTVTLS